MVSMSRGVSTPGDGSSLTAAAVVFLGLIVKRSIIDPTVIHYRSATRALRRTDDELCAETLVRD